MFSFILFICHVFLNLLYLSSPLPSSKYIMFYFILCIYHVLFHTLLSCPPSFSLSIMSSCIPFIFHIRLFPLSSSSPIMYSSILFHVLCSLSSFSIMLSTLHIRSLFSFFFYHVISPLFFTLIKYLLFSL